MQDGNDINVRQFLKKITQTIFTLVIWMLLNVFIGFQLQWAYVYDKLNTLNYIFFVFFLFSLGLLLYYYWRLWFRKR